MDITHRCGALLAPGVARIATLLCAAMGIAGCASSPEAELIAMQPPGAGFLSSPYVIVDCLLPPQLIRQGERAVRMTPSRPAKMSARLCAQQGGAQTEGLRAWKALADSGNAEAQTYLGEMYESGIGGAPHDVAMATALFQRAADAGNARAASNLALLYANGAPGLRADRAKAEEAMVQAAANVGVRTLVVEPARPVRVDAGGGGATVDLHRFAFGRYHALLIGISDYQRAPRLSSPVHEIDVIGEVLQRRYGFKITKLRNATGEQILRKLDDLEQDLTEADNLLVYYTGHGAESAAREGYWIPVDGEGPNSTDGYRTAHWVSSSTVREKLSVMKPRHILVVADSCYSARFLQFRGFFKASPATVASAYLDSFAKLYSARSRNALTSGGLAPVLEPTDGTNISLFARSFTRFLERNREPIPSVQIFSAIGTEVMNATSAIGFPQQPQWGPITGAGHETGDFWFLPQ